MSRDLRQPRLEPPEEPNTGTLLLVAFQRFEAELFEEFRRHGHGGVRRKHGAVLANVDRDGSRLTDLAAHAGMTKASMSELVAELESMGYIERREDPSDRRSRRILLTPLGVQLARLARQVIEAIESRYARLLGENQYGNLRLALLQLIGDGDQPAGLPRTP